MAIGDFKLAEKAEPGLRSLDLGRAASRGVRRTMEMERSTARGRATSDGVRRLLRGGSEAEPRQSGVRRASGCCFVARSRRSQGQSGVGRTSGGCFEAETVELRAERRRSSWTSGGAPTDGVGHLKAKVKTKAKFDETTGREHHFSDHVGRSLTEWRN